MPTGEINLNEKDLEAFKKKQEEIKGHVEDLGRQNMDNSFSPQIKEDLKKNKMFNPINFVASAYMMSGVSLLSVLLSSPALIEKIKSLFGGSGKKSPEQILEDLAEASRLDEIQRKAAEDAKKMEEWKKFQANQGAGSSTGVEPKVTGVEPKVTESLSESGENPASRSLNT